MLYPLCQEVVSDVMYEPPTKKSRSLTAAIINAADNRNLDAKITITQEEVSVDYSTIYVEESLSETPKVYAKLCDKEIPQKRTANMTTLSKARNYHISEIIYNLYEGNIFKNKKEINFVSITAPYFIKDTEKSGQCMDITDDAVNPYHIITLKKQLDKAELKRFS